MAIIENFAELSEREQKDFAAAIIKTINTENIFTSEVDFEIHGVEVDDFDGSLMIHTQTSKPLEVTREATWSCANEDDVGDDPGYDATFENSIYDDVQSALKTLSTELEGYKISIDVSDTGEEETVEVNAEHYSHEDGGIGHYEYWGHDEYDSSPYVEVEGTIVKACICYVTFTVEPVDAVSEKTTADAEEN